MPQPVTIASQGIGKQAAVQVNTVATLLTAGVTKDRKNITITNNGPNTIYIGFDNTVTTSTGTPIAAGSAFSADLGSGTTVYAITTALQVSPADTRVLETM
jgi:hypothetical protein